MAVSAETREQCLPYPDGQCEPREVYNGSLRAIRTLGQLALGEGQSFDTEQLTGTEAYRDFITGVAENIATDPDYSDKLTFNRVQRHDIVAGRAVDTHGRSIADMVRSGHRSSQSAAQQDPRMGRQADRDSGDVMIADLVDQLRPGQRLSCISMDPKEAIATDPTFWQETMGYRLGMAVRQDYYRLEDEVVTVAYAIKGSDVTALRNSWNTAGGAVPTNVSCDQFVCYPIIEEIDEEAGMQLAQAFVDNYHQSRGLNNIRSVTDFLSKHVQTIETVFTSYIVPLAWATVQNKNQDSLRTLAAELHQTAGPTLQPELRCRLLQITNSDRFTDNDARDMEDLIRYATVEMLRPALKQYLGVAPSVVAEQSFAGYDSTTTVASPPAWQQQASTMQQLLAIGVREGAGAGRSYGGCAGGSAPGQQGNVSDPLGRQDVFGGVLSDQKAESANEAEDQYGPLTFECTEGHKNTRPRGKLIDMCQHKGCKGSVGCG